MPHYYSTLTLYVLIQLHQKLYSNNSKVSTLQSTQRIVNTAQGSQLLNKEYSVSIKTSTI
jgi:hypothetical protein